MLRVWDYDAKERCHEHFREIMYAFFTLRLTICSISTTGVTSTFLARRDGDDQDDLRNSFDAAIRIHYPCCNNKHAENAVDEYDSLQ